MNEMQDTDSTVESAVAATARVLARRFTRRSALARIGRYGLAASVAAPALALVDAEDAWAAPGGCQGCSPYGGGGCSSGKCANESTWCGDGGDCPSYACRCGAWVAGTCSDGSTMYYGDCCGACGGGGDCSCANSGSGSCCGASGSGSFNCNGTGQPCPSCCHQINWYSDPNRACGDCETGSPWYIHCRRSFCA